MNRKAVVTVGAALVAVALTGCGGNTAATDATVSPSVPVPSSKTSTLPASPVSQSTLAEVGTWLNGEYGRIVGDARGNKKALRSTYTRVEGDQTQQRVLQYNEDGTISAEESFTVGGKLAKANSYVCKSKSVTDQTGMRCWRKDSSLTPEDSSWHETQPVAEQTLATLASTVTWPVLGDPSITPMTVTIDPGQGRADYIYRMSETSPSISEGWQVSDNSISLKSVAADGEDIKADVSFVVESVPSGSVAFPGSQEIGKDDPSLAIAQGG